MFLEKKEKKVIENLSIQNFISQGTTVVGDLKSEGDFRIDGIIKGNIKTSGKVVVGKSGFIKGDLQANEAYFEGKFLGKLTLKTRLTLKSTAQVEGEIIIGKLVVEPGAIFNATCVMRGSAKETEKSENQEPKESERIA